MEKDKPLIAGVYRLYDKELLSRSVIDFDDLINKTDIAEELERKMESANSQIETLKKQLAETKALLDKERKEAAKRSEAEKAPAEKAEKAEKAAADEKTVKSVPETKTPARSARPRGAAQPKSAEQ